MRLAWDETGEKLYETGVKKTVLYPFNTTTNSYDAGYAWNGVSAVNESPEGAEANPIYADDTKYLNLYSAEELNASIEAYMSPKEFDECDGTAELTKGVKIGQQNRKSFGLCYRTTIGNDTVGNEYGYKLHILYGCKASPSERGYTTINDSPEAISFSWEISTTPVNVTGHNPTSVLTIDSTDFVTEQEKARLTDLEDVLYGTTETAARLPLPDEIKRILEGSSSNNVVGGGEG